MDKKQEYTVTMVRFKEAVEVAHNTRTGLTAAGNASQKPAQLEMTAHGILIAHEGDKVLVPWGNIRQASFKAIG
jgi:hypothetical protein